ncbi:MAG: hypothetical protein QOE70_3511 [Chthoniobacter sp.]|jgi:Fic family protein|nr:hypothetical protein [Chthoniobacter sp.]
MKLPQNPPLFDTLLQKSTPTRLMEIFRAGNGAQQRYFHWNELRFRPPPQGLNHEEWWLVEKMARQTGRRALDLKDKHGQPFSYVVPEFVAELLHLIDRDGGTLLRLPEPVTDPEERDRYVIRSLMEEAITSSQLEGAAVTREVAKKMLAEGRRPRDRGEQMIVNNFITMRRIIELKTEPLTPDLVLSIHRQISENALDKPDAAGRLRRPDETVEVSDEYGTIFHTPPPADELSKRLELMCEFANASTDQPFIHPVVRAIIVHFWLAYDHPFVDGNGRTARALFYWEMLHRGYWLFEFVSISQFLRKAPVPYGEAFLHSETDDNDLTYFIIHQAGIIRRSLEELHDYVAKKSRETRGALKLLHENADLNHRQQVILTHALRHPNQVYTVAEHQTLQGIAYATARADLLGLAQRGLLDQRKRGNAFIFIAPADLEKRLRRDSE